MSKRIRFGVFKRDSFTCRYCGATAPNVQLQIDHVVPVSDGGTDDPDNLVTACAACNVGKGARPLDDDDASPLKDDGSVALDSASDGGSRFDPDDPAGSALREGGVSDAATGFANRRQQAKRSRSAGLSSK